MIPTFQSCGENFKRILLIYIAVIIVMLYVKCRWNYHSAAGDVRPEFPSTSYVDMEDIVLCTTWAGHSRETLLSGEIREKACTVHGQFILPEMPRNIQSLFFVFFFLM